MKRSLFVIGVWGMASPAVADPGWGYPPMPPSIAISPPMIVLPQVMVTPPVIAMPSVPVFGGYGRYDPEWEAYERHGGHHGHRHHHHHRD